MTVEDRNGIVLDFSEPETAYDRIVVTHCRPGKPPEKIGSIRRVFDEKTDTVTYHAVNQYLEGIGHVTTNWNEVEGFYQKYAYDLSRNEVHQTFVRIMQRVKELNDIRKGKGKNRGREILI